MARSLKLVAFVCAGVLVLMWIALSSVRSSEAGLGGGGRFWEEAAFIAAATFIGVGASFRTSWNRPWFWLTLVIAVSAQFVVVVSLVPDGAHLLAIWGGLAAYCEFLAISTLLSRLGFR
jgi:hypothetical protein